MTVPPDRLEPSPRGFYLPRSPRTRALLVEGLLAVLVTLAAMLAVWITTFSGWCS